MVVQTERSTFAEDLPPTRTPADVSLAHPSRRWVWMILTGAAAVGVVNVIAIALVG